jgi:LuxR family transcriptional regulator, activator of conjugal transfer of Ti plasmids
VHSLPYGRRHELNQWFEHLTEQISLATDEDAARIVLERLTGQAGFTGFAYVSIRPGVVTAISNYSPDWQKRYGEKSYAKIDPIMRGIRQRNGAFSWAAPVGRVSKEKRQFFAEAAEFGIKAGISIPINAGFGHSAILTLASDEVGFVESREVDPIIAAATVGQMHSRLDMMRIVPKLQIPVRLKPDELTCLRWSAEGKSMKAIAVIEDTSYANVCFHLRNAKQALGATTLPQATAIATLLGLI